MVIVIILGIFITIIIIIIIFILYYTLGFLKLSCSGSANVHLLGCFSLWTFPLNIGLNMLPSDPFMSCLDYLLGCY